MTSQPTSPVPSSEILKHALKKDHWIDPLNNGMHILIRPLEAKDREREFDFIKNLSPESRHFRFLCTMQEPSQPLLDQLMDVDYSRRMAYVALTMEGGHLTEIGVARYAALEDDEQCESAVVVADQWQNKGLGTRLMAHLIDAARRNGFKQMISIESATNSHMHHLADELGFECGQDPQDATQIIYRLKLG